MTEIRIEGDKLWFKNYLVGVVNPHSVTLPYSVREDFLRRIGVDHTNRLSYDISATAIKVHKRPKRR